MFKKELANGVVIQEVSPTELGEIQDLHFERIFKNRVSIDAPTLDSETRSKISERAKVENRFRLCLVIKKDTEVAGWHYGFSMNPETYYMQNSAILEKFRNQGLYSEMLKAVQERLHSEGFQVLTSNHHPNNAAVLIPKLKAGFVISGMQMHERFKFLIELKYFFNEERRKIYDKNIGLEV